jgi:hypothetical protein
MKVILSFLNFSILWFVSFWTFYGLFDIDGEWWWVPSILGSCFVYAAIFSARMIEQESALNSLVSLFANFMVHGLFWCVVMAVLFFGLMHAAQSSPDFNPNDKETQLAVAFAWVGLLAGIAILHLPIVVIGIIGWSISKPFQIRRKSSNKSFKLTALRAAA